MGIFVDIFPIDGIDEKNAKKIYKKTSYYSKMSCVAANRKFHKSKKGIKASILKFFGFFYSKIFGWKYWCKKYEKTVRKYDFNSYQKSLAYSGVYGLKEVLDKQIYENTTLIDFEDSKFPIMQDYDAYLKALYKNYMELPPVEKRITHHDFKFYKK